MAKEGKGCSSEQPFLERARAASPTPQPSYCCRASWRKLFATGPSILISENEGCPTRQPFLTQRHYTIFTQGGRCSANLLNCENKNSIKNGGCMCQSMSRFYCDVNKNNQAVFPESNGDRRKRMKPNAAALPRNARRAVSPATFERDRASEDFAAKLQAS
jgi:hypothetical protein